MFSLPAGYGSFMKMALPLLIVIYAWNAALLCIMTVTS
jgi:hypothetical protein